ncbi:hypothetical protein M5689_024000 [Euphorbia peplus]|nr:hypothetical protein M5689_024000 [Euphorbia peplus]
MGEEKHKACSSSVLKLQDLPSNQTFRQTLDQLQSRASSLISLSLQWKDLDSHFSSLRSAIQLRENNLRSAHDSLQLKLDDVKNRESRLEALQKSLSDKTREIEEFQILQKKEIEGLELSRKEIQVAKESVERDSRLLELKEDKFRVLNDQKTRELREIEERVDHAKKELLIKEGEIEERLRQVAVKEKEVDELRKELESKGDRFKDLEFKEKVVRERAEEVELEKNKYVELCKEVELKQKQLNDNAPGNKVSGFAVTLDGKALQTYLNEHCGDYESMRNVVSMVLGLSSDPSMLVLDALQGFYPPHLKKGEKEFEEEIVRRSCILLLDELMKLGPEIRPPVKKQAKAMAIAWLKKLNSHVAHSLQVLGFLLLLASYGLASSFDADKLLTRLEIISLHSQAPRLFVALGLTTRLTDFIQNLIRKKKLNEAIRYIYAFEKVSEFQPVSLLDDYLRISKIATRQMKKRDKSVEGQIKAANKRLADIKYALRCIEECKIEYGSSLKNLESQVEWLEKEISKKRASISVGDKIQSSQDEKEKHSALPVAVVDAPAPIPIPVTASATSSVIASTSVPATPTQPQQSSGNTHPRADELAGKGLKECDIISQASATSTNLAPASVPTTTTESQQLKGNKCLVTGKISEECHGADQVSAISSTLATLATTSVPATTSQPQATTSIPATTSQPQQLSGNKLPADVTGGKNSKECHGADQESATSSILPSTSVPSTVAKPKQLSGNKRPGSDVKGGKKLKVCHGADQECEKSCPDDLPSESNKVSASLSRQPKTNFSSVNPSKEELKKLIDMCEKHQLDDGEIAAALQSACDPGKLVLDLMNVPVPFKLDGSKEFMAHLRKTSCLLLLKQFRTVSFQIKNSEIRQAAKKFALYWETTVAIEGKKSPLDVICFLQFLACFKLGSIFNAEDLLDLLDTDHWRKDAPDLCEVLGLADKIPSFIQNRLKKAQHLEAVKYIHALDVVEKFSPSDILIDYLNISSKSRKKPVEAQIVDIDKEIKSLKDVIQCVRDYNVTGLSPEKFEDSIRQLEKEKEEKQRSIRASKFKTRQVSPASARRSSASRSNAREQHGRRNKWTRAHLSPDNRPKPYTSVRSEIHQRPLQHPPRSYVDRGVPFMNSPPRHYGWPAYGPHDVELNNYGAPVTPSYHWDSLGNFSHNRPSPY